MDYRFTSPNSSAMSRETPPFLGIEETHLAERAAPFLRRIPEGRPPELLARRPRRIRKAVSTKAVPPPPSAAVIALRRLAFGPRPGDVAAFNALGATDAQRLSAWLDGQLDPASIDDSAAEARIAQSGFTTLGKSLTQLWTDHVAASDMLSWEEVMRPYGETVLATFLRAIYSKRQLFEVLVDFWHNHFNVFADEFPMGPLWVHTDRDAIRAHALGNFREMIEAVAKTPAMLYYLNNNESSFEDANENYAREMLELHGLGSAAYYGSIPESAVPKDGDGRPLGYVEETVVAAARCLTGWTVDDRWWEGSTTGNFLYRDEWHDQGSKTVLGVSLPANQPAMKDGRDLFDLVAQHPATGRHIATKLCRRLLGDFPPDSVVDAAAAVFTAQHQASDQIAQTVRTIVESSEFLTTWGEKVKRPFEIAVSIFRGTGGDLPFVYREGATDYFLWMYYSTGQPLFSWHPPNGYPDLKAAWSSTSPRVMCWRLANMLTTVSDESWVPYFDLVGSTPPSVRSANEIVDFWAQRMLGEPPAAAERDKLVSFMAQGINPAFDLPLATDEDIQDRLRALVALIAMSPSFLWR